MNPFRNEKKITLGAQEILLRPTFENIAALEADMGSLAYLAYKFSRGARIMREAKEAGRVVTSEDVVKCMPSLSDIAKIIFHNQANEPKKTLAEIWDMVSEEGVTCTNAVLEYVSKVAAGKNEVDDVKGEEKKA